jgi:hypothetical protein
MKGIVNARKPNNSFNPTLASEFFIIKLCGFCRLVAVALASGGLIRALCCLQADERINAANT